MSTILSTYIQGVLLTECKYGGFGDPELAESQPVLVRPAPRICHANIGILGETRELRGARTATDIIEELGDMCWYAGILIDVLAGLSQQSVPDFIAEHALFDGSEISAVWLSETRGRAMDTLRRELETELFDEVIFPLGDNLKRLVFYIDCSPTHVKYAELFKKIVEALRRFFALVGRIAFLQESTVEAVMRANARKLIGVRYRKGFSSQEAFERSLSDELRALAGG